MELVIDRAGGVRCIYGEAVELCAIGKVAIQRASNVEPRKDGLWMVDLAPVEGPLLGPYLKRTAALAAEHQWLIEHWLGKSTEVNG